MVDGELQIYSATLTELSDDEYPDNPDISIRHVKYTETMMDEIHIMRSAVGFDIIVNPISDSDDTVCMLGVDLMEFIPTIPDYAKEDEYMSLIALVNQEWNRNQVKWTGEELKTIIPKPFVVNGERITRIDLARNCLNSYLWELFFYTEVDGSNKVFYHGWFDFPKELYHELFEERNARAFSNYADFLENWKNPPTKSLNLSLIREVQQERGLQFTDQSSEMYPLLGERKKKQIEIIYPRSYTQMADFHTDSALFATFSPPGYYNREDPRTTELGRFYQLDSIIHRRTTSGTSTDENDELELVFSRKNGEITRFLIGGLDLETLPPLAPMDANSGSQFSMGIGNHPFYEDCKAHDAISSATNPYFGMLLNEMGEWLDSHKIGIDGPLLHLDDEDPNILHLWLLSFERHALVGHYKIYLR